MNVFFKIGLPWAISLGLVFFVGLYLGSKNAKPSSSPLVANSTEAEMNKKHVSSQQKQHSPELLKDNEPVEVVPTPTPPMPPNLQRIMQGGDIVERLGSYLDAVRSMDRSNVKQVIQAFEELPSGYGRHLEMKLLMRSWANFDPEGALAYASSSLDAKSERRFGISEALAGWAVKDERAAIAWAENNYASNPTGDNPLLVGVVKGLMETDLDAANRLFLSLPKGTARWQSSTLLADKFAQSGSEKAIQWAESYPLDDPRMRETILGQMGAKLAQIDLQATANWAKSMSPEPGADRVTENLILKWARQDPQAVASWIDDLDDPNRKVHAMASLAWQWGLVDPASTADWLNSYPAESQFDPAIVNFVSAIKGRDPEGAIEWAKSIQNQDLQKNSIHQALDSWKQTDPNRASQWMQQNNIENNRTY